MATVSTPLLVSVIIVTYNDGDWLPRCLESLRGQTIFNQIEVIIADNASTNGTDRKAQDLLTNWNNGRFIQNGANLGFGAGNNRGVAIARGEFLFFTNSDTWFEPDCLENLYQAVGAAHATGGSAMTLEYTCDNLLSLGCDGFDVFGNPVLFSENRIPSRIFCMAGFLFVRKDAFERIGCFDNELFMYGEELDVSWRLLITGHELVAAPKAKVHHRGEVGANPTGGAIPLEHRTSPKKRFLANRNHLIVIAKNAHCLLLLLLIPSTLLIIAEGLFTLLMTRNWATFSAGYLSPFADFWRVQAHIRSERKKISTVRRHGDFWMLRFFSLKFGRWQQLQQLWRKGFPRFT